MLYQKKHEQSIEKARAAQLENEKFDVKTGKELFRPQILKTPHNDRDRNIWEELYSHKKKPISFNTPSVRLIDKNSEKITERIRYRRYNEIFQSLSPINGIIRYVTIDFKIVDIQIVEILNPLIEELAESKQELDFKQFCEAMDALIKILTPQEKWYLMFIHKDKEEYIITQVSNITSRRESKERNKESFN